MPAPSPNTNPSRSLSQGRLAFSGSSLRVESARMAANPPKPSGLVAISAPPTNMTSASPDIINRAPKAMLCAPVVQAVTNEILGPCQPYIIEICPGSKLIRSEEHTSELQSQFHL